jgi:hypothetical protein
MLAQLGFESPQDTGELQRRTVAGQGRWLLWNSNSVRWGWMLGGQEGYGKNVGGGSSPEQESGLGSLTQVWEGRAQWVQHLRGCLEAVESSRWVGAGLRALPWYGSILRIAGSGRVGCRRSRSIPDQEAGRSRAGVVVHCG